MVLPAFARLVLVFSLSLVPAPDSGSVTGTVADASGRPVPRAIVEVITRAGATVASVFTDADGSFRVVNAPEGCRLQASLTGFTTATADCAASTPVKLTLSIAPISDQVVVSATRTEAPSGQVAAAVTVFDAADIARRQEPMVSDLLRDAPGAMVVRTGAPGGVTSLFVRGGESDYTKVLLDGVPLNDPGGAFDLSNVTSENLDRVEFVRGADSALYGTDAMTGVVQLFTKRGATATPVFHFDAEGGSFSTARGSAGVTGKAGDIDYSLDGSGYSTDNSVPNDRFRNATISGSAGAAFAHDATLRVIGRVEDGHAGTPGQTAFGRPDLDAYYKRLDGVLGVSFDQSFGAFHQRAAYGFDVQHQQSTNLVIDPPYTPSYGSSTSSFEFEDFAYDSRTDITRHHASYQADQTWATAHAGTHVDTALVDWDGERVALLDTLANTSVPASRDNVGVSLQHQALWSQIFVTAGVRFEHNASFGNATVPRVSGAAYLRKSSGRIGSTRVHASAGTGIKEPDFTQSFSTSPYFLGNPDLKPERSRSLDAGIEQRLANDRARFDVTWFDNRYKDIIGLQTVDPSLFTAQYFNIGLTTAKGAELSGDVALVSGFRARAGYTYLDSNILQSTSTSPVFQPGNEAFRRPKHSGFVDLAWLGRRATADLTGTFVGRRVDSDLSSLDPPLTSNPGYTLWDLRASAQLTGRLSLTGAIDNLADRQYMEPLGYPALGRAFRIGIRVHN